MKRSYGMTLPIVAFLLAVMTGCSKSTAEKSPAPAEKLDPAAEAGKKLVGQWKIDTEAVKQSILAEMTADAAENPDVNTAMAMAMVEGIIAQMELTFEFTPTGSLIVNAPGGSETNAWKIVGVEEEKIGVEVDGEISYITFISDDTFEMSEEDQKASLPGMSSLLFHRIQ